MRNFSLHPHRRFNPLTGQWVLVSPHRSERPWSGEKEPLPSEERPQYDPNCYLCPGNQRAGGCRNPDYSSTFVFENDFPALLSHEAETAPSQDHLFQFRNIRGTCRVVCFSPRHDLTMAQMSVGEIAQIVDVWAHQSEELGKEYQWVQIFENKGSMMGCSNPHPHGQIWASANLPNEPSIEDRNQKDYYRRNKSVLLMNYVEREGEKKERVVVENEHWLAVVPYWAIWPFETLLLPRRHVLRLQDLMDTERISLAHILRLVLIRYDNLFETSFPYSMGWHGAPNQKGDVDHWQLHAHFYPPLLRSAFIKKFLVGYEMLAEAQRDLLPEQVAERLRHLPEIHYKEK